MLFGDNNHAIAGKRKKGKKRNRKQKKGKKSKL